MSVVIRTWEALIRMQMKLGLQMSNKRGGAFVVVRDRESLLHGEGMQEIQFLSFNFKAFKVWHLI